MLSGRPRENEDDAGLLETLLVPRSAAKLKCPTECRAKGEGSGGSGKIKPCPNPREEETAASPIPGERGSTLYTWGLPVGF